MLRCLFFSIVFLLAACTSLQEDYSTKLPEQKFDIQLQEVTTDPFPGPVVDGEEVIILLPCKRYSQEYISIYPNSVLDPEELKSAIGKSENITKKYPELSVDLEFQIKDFYGNEDTVGEINPTNKSLCLVVFDVPQMDDLNTIAEEFQSSICSLWGVNAVCPNIYVGANIWYTTDGRKSNDPTCETKAIDRLNKDSETAQTISEKDLRQLLGVYDYSLTGEGVDIAILDSGASSDLVDSPSSRNFMVKHWPIETIKREAESDFNDDYVCDEKPDLNSHGSKVTTLVRNLAPNASIAMMKVCNSDGCPTSAIAKALLYYINGYTTKIPQVINTSFGTAELPEGVSSTGEDVILKHLIEQLSSSSLIVASAGNNPNPKGNPHYPASHEYDLGNVIAVAAAKLPNDGRLLEAQNLTLANFNSGVTEYSVAGVNVEVWVKEEDKKFKTYKFTGTSAAAPIVTALAALHIEREGPISPYTVRKDLQNSCIGSEYSPIPTCLIILPRLLTMPKITLPVFPSPSPFFP